MLVGNGDGSSNLILRIGSMMRSLTKAERRVAEKVLENPEAAVYDSVTDMAEKAGVGETTVLRFCRSMGCRGYQDFKLALAREQAGPARNLNESVAETDDMATILMKVGETNARAVTQTTAISDADALSRAVDAFLHGRRVNFYGVGMSGITALDAMYKFRRIGVFAEGVLDPHFASMSAALLEPGDVAVGISHSGSSKETVDALTLARKAGATVICVTAHARSPITAVSDIVLLTAPRETPLQGSSFAAKIAQIHVLDTLFIALALRDKERALSLTEKTARAVAGRLY